MAGVSFNRSAGPRVCQGRKAYKHRGKKLVDLLVLLSSLLFLKRRGCYSSQAAAGRKQTQVYDAYICESRHLRIHPKVQRFLALRYGLARLAKRKQASHKKIAASCQAPQDDITYIHTYPVSAKGKARARKRRKRAEHHLGLSRPAPGKKKIGNCNQTNCNNWKCLASSIAAPDGFGARPMLFFPFVLSII